MTLVYAIQRANFVIVHFHLHADFITNLHNQLSVGHVLPENTCADVVRSVRAF